MPVDPKRRNAAQESAESMISMAGVRPLVESSVAVSATSADSYTITHSFCKRVLLFHTAANDDDIRVDLDDDNAGVATDMPLASGVYFVFEAYEGEIVRLYNTTGSPVTVYIWELQ